MLKICASTKGDVNIELINSHWRGVPFFKMSLIFTSHSTRCGVSLEVFLHRACRCLRHCNIVERLVSIAD